MKVLVALDDSPVSIRAAREAARLFSGHPDTEILVINVTSVPTAWVGGAGYGMVGPMIMDPRWLDPDPADETAHELQLMASATAAGMPDAEVMVRTGDAVQQICGAAEEHAVDVIVVGSHDKSALHRLFDPSVSSRVIRETYLPVLVVSGEPPTLS